MTLHISGYALLGVRQKTTDYVHAEGASAYVVQVSRSYFYINLFIPSEIVAELKDIYLVTSAHTHVNNKDVAHFPIVKTPVKLVIQNMIYRYFLL